MTDVQARKFELEGILPDCRFVNPDSERNGCHNHLSYEQAEALVGKGDGTGQARWVGGKFMIVMNVKGGYNRIFLSMQLTRHASQIPPGHYAVGAVGAHGRRTTVKDTNNPQPEATG